MKKKSVLKNYIYNLSYQILAILLPLITTPYLSRVLGAENIGIYSYTISITTYFILFGSLGVGMYGQREIAYVQDKKDKRSKIFFEILLMRTITLFISIIIFYFTFCLSGQYSMYYKILLLELLATVIDISWFFQGIEEFKKTVIRNMIIKLIGVVCIFAFVKSVNDLNKYLFIYVLSNFFGNLVLWFYVPKYIEKINLKELNIKRHIKPTIVLFIPQIATQIYTVLDKTMIGIIVSDKSEVGFYEQAQKIVKLCLTIATSFGTVMVPRIASTYANGEKEKVKQYMNKSFSFILMLAFPLMFGLISISNNFVPLFYGDGYDKVAILICTISPIIIAIGLSNVIGTQYLLPTKQHSKFTISVVCGAMVNFLFNLLLINKYQSIGASVATVIAEISVTAVQFYLVKDEIKFIDVVKLSYRYIIASLIMFLCSLFISFIIANGIVSIVIQIIVSVFIYFGILFILKDSMLLEKIGKLKFKLLKKSI